MPRRSVVPGFRFDGKSGRAFFEVVVPGTGGRERRRKKVTVETRDKALALFKKFRTEVLRKRDANPEIFADYVFRYWPLIKMRLGAKTAAFETAIVENDLTPFFGLHRLEEINAALIKDFVALLRTHKQAPSTINRKVSVLRKILNDAVAREIVAEFPAKGRLSKEK